MWQGLQIITDYERKTSHVGHWRLAPGQAEQLLCPLRITQCHRRGPTPQGLFSMANKSKIFKRVNPHKAAGPDDIPSRVLRAWADQLAGVFPDIFNLSRSQSAVPTCFKMSTIVPVPKKTKVTELNEYQRVALTSVMMKCFERLVNDHKTSTLPGTLDSLKFAYHPYHTAHCLIPSEQEGCCSLTTTQPST